jgi:hypothetical protein
MKIVNTKSVQSLSELDRTFSCFEKIYQNRKKNNLTVFEKYPKKEEDPFNDNFEEITRQIKLFDYVSSGLDENIEKIEAIIKKDPLRNMYDPCDKHHYFINKTNSDGFTVLYVACLNGQQKIVEILLKNHADPLKKCGVIKLIIKNLG